MYMRLGIGLPLGLAITFLLFLLMSQLISTNFKLDDDEVIKIADITMPDTKIKAQVEEEKPDKPDELNEPPPPMQQHEMEVDAPTDALNIASSAKEFSAEISSGGGFARDSDFIPVYVPTPRYPQRALKAGKEGYAVIEVIVTASGGVRDPRLIEEWPENYGFGRESIKAADKLKYNPRVVDGVAVEVPEVKYKFTFTIAEKKRGR
jgi:protein TonB